MRVRASVAVARNDWRLLRRDPVPWLIFVSMPLVLMAFVSPAYRPGLVAEGHAGANGSEQAVPGMAMMFAFFLIGTIGTAFFREHGWATWDRLRASPASMAEIMLGKVVVPLASTTLQLTLVFVIGGAIFRLTVAGSPIALGLVMFSFASCLVGLTFVVVTFCRTIMQLNIASSVGALSLAGLGGALTPVDALPGWAHLAAPITPGYWAMQGFREVIINGGGVSDILVDVAVLLAATSVLGIVAAVRFRDDERKLGWA